MDTIVQMNGTVIEATTDEAVVEATPVKEATDKVSVGDLWNSVFAVDKTIKGLQTQITQLSSDWEFLKTSCDAFHANLAVQNNRPATEVETAGDTACGCGNVVI